MHICTSSPLLIRSGITIGARGQHWQQLPVCFRQHRESENNINGKGRRRNCCDGRCTRVGVCGWREKERVSGHWWRDKRRPSAPSGCRAVGAPMLPGGEASTSENRLEREETVVFVIFSLKKETEVFLI